MSKVIIAESNHICHCFHIYFKLPPYLYNR